MVGETGAGKSLTAWAAIGLLPRSARMTSGHVWYEDSDLTALPPQTLSSLRGREIAIIVQNPSAALSPMTRIGDQLVNAYRAHQKRGPGDGEGSRHRRPAPGRHPGSGSARQRLSP